jgi:diguanylate cyclase (GGDEF)-like protein
VERPLPAATPAAAPRERRPLPAAAQVFLLVLGLTTGGLFALTLTRPTPSTNGLASFVALFALVLAADRLELYTGRSVDMRVATVPMVAAALLLPAPLVMLCGGAFALARLSAPLQLRQRLFNGCSHALSGLAAWGVVQLVPGHAAHGGAGIAFAGIAATVAYALCAWMFLVSILHFARDLALAEMRQQLPALLVAEGGLGALGIVVAALWRMDAVLVPFAIVPLVLIWSALQISELRTEANIDAKTGLYNARHLRGALASELDRATRYQRPLSLLLADLDFLRDVNNQHGHLAGDAVLAEIGEVLRDAVRSTDIPARFGGEEFCVVLPETPGPKAALLAERIRSAVDERAFEIGRGMPPLHVTVSIGVASFPADASSDDDLIEAADAAVYAAKAGGRNRVCVVGEPVTAAATAN